MDRHSIFAPFPTLETERLRLRALRPDDLDDLWAYSSDPEIDRYTPWERYRTREEAQADLQRYLDDYSAGNMSVWGVEHRAERRLIGICNFSYWRPEHRRAEIGYTIARTHWGNGYATEAGRVLIDFGFTRMHLIRVEAICMPDNLASMRVLERLGMQREGLLRSYEIWRDRPQDLKLYSIIRPGT